MKEERLLFSYLVFLEDAQDFFMGCGKSQPHCFSPLRMEQGEVENYSQIDKIDRIRPANA